MIKDRNHSNSWQKSIRGFCFDLDNTLYDRDAAARKVFASWLDARPDSPTTLEEILQKDAHGYADRTRFFAWLNRQLGCDDLLSRFQQEIPAASTLPENSLKLLKILKRGGIPVSILTNGGSVQRAKIESLNLAALVPRPNIFVGGEIGISKPAPRIFALVADCLELPPENILMVGDHLEFDIRGASGAGFRTCWIHNSPDEHPPQADLIADSPADLIQLAEDISHHAA